MEPIRDDNISDEKDPGPDHEYELAVKKEFALSFVEAMMPFLDKHSD